MAVWSTAWAIEFPAGTADELLLALVVRDLAHGASFDVEAEDADAEFAIDFTAGDEREGGVYRLLLSAEIDGHDDPALIQAFTEQMLEEMLGEAEALVSHRTDVGNRDLAALELRAVPEDEERWDLVMPDWLAPDGAEVPFGFRGFERESGVPVPDNPTLDGHGRIVAFDHDGRYLMIGIPAPAVSEHA